MHSEICPVCQGKGQIDKGFQDYDTCSKRMETCHGCDGKGWISVPDSQQDVYKEDYEEFKKWEGPDTDPISITPFPNDTYTDGSSTSIIDDNLTIF